jgi:L-iditol 2-dehydrogenase
MPHGFSISAFLISGVPNDNRSGIFTAMKAMMLTGIRRMEMRDVPDPKIVSPHDVLLRMKAVGVCGSDLHYFTWGRIGEQVVEFPFVVGHEGAAEVAAVGSAVTTVKPGDRVVVEPSVACGKCDQCQAGRPHTCRHNKFLGCPGQMPGCFSEFIVMPEECCLLMPPAMSWEDGALIEPLAIGLYSARCWLDLRGKRIGILGAGPIGLSVQLMAQHFGAEKIYVTDKLDYRLDAARRAGATWTGNPAREDIVAAINRAEPLQLDAVFECCGQQEAVDQSMALLAPGGTLFLIGIHETERISFSLDHARRREIALQNVRRQCHCTEDAINLVAAGHVKPGFMITHRFPLADTARAFEILADYGDGVIKAMIHFP